jgi:hypothetical protein
MECGAYPCLEFAIHRSLLFDFFQWPFGVANGVICDAVGPYRSSVLCMVHMACESHARAQKDSMAGEKNAASSTVRTTLQQLWNGSKSSLITAMFYKYTGSPATGSPAETAYRYLSRVEAQELQQHNVSAKLTAFIRRTQ